MITTLMAPTKTGERPKPPPHDPEQRTRVVHLRNAVLEEDLQDDELYAELVDDDGVRDVRRRRRRGNPETRW